MDIFLSCSEVVLEKYRDEEGDKTSFTPQNRFNHGANKHVKNVSENWPLHSAEAKDLQDVLSGINGNFAY